MTRATPLLVFALLNACGSDEGTPANRGPVIDDVDAPTEVAASGGQYNVPVKLAFHDDDKDSVTKLRLQIPAGKFDQTTAIQGAQPEAVGATVTIALNAASVPANTYDLKFSVFDAKGLESNVVDKQIKFK